MSYFDNPENLKLLKNLFASDEYDKPETTKSPVQSGTSSSNNFDASKPVSTTYSGAYRKLDETAQPQANPSNIDEWEAFEAQQFGNSFNDLKTPEYRITYKQAVAPEDMFLCMGNKTAATASCEEMCLEIELPNETKHIDQMQLDVNPNEIELKTAVYHLKLPLVQRINVDRSKAMWDDQRKLLRLMLRMKREYDFINF